MKIRHFIKQSLINASFGVAAGQLTSQENYEKLIRKNPGQAGITLDQVKIINSYFSFDIPICFIQFDEIYIRLTQGRSR